nr:metalloregulator ArsR/SmtB family transcription factor [Georgenia sp. SYP-B2076]
METPLYEIKAELFKSLAHPVRIRTLELLSERDRAVSELLADIGIEASHLSQHLAVLRRAGTVTKVRRGNTVTYTLADPSVAQMLGAARGFLVHRLGHAAGALAGLADGAVTRATPDTGTTPATADDATTAR